MSLWIRRALSSRTLSSIQRNKHQFGSLSHLCNINSIQSGNESSLVGTRFGSELIFFANRRGFAKGKRSISDHSFLPRRTFSVITSKLPSMSDPEVETAFKDLMAMSWDDIPDSVITSAKKALSKESTDKAGQEALKNLFQAAEASVEFGGTLVSLRMALDDLNGITGEVSPATCNLGSKDTGAGVRVRSTGIRRFDKYENMRIQNVGKLPEYLEDAMKAAYNRYMTYLESFGPDEAYLRKKVESELGTKMIHLKMRCSGIGSEWGKVSLLGTSGISGSYVEQRA